MRIPDEECVQEHIRLPLLGCVSLCCALSGNFLYQKSIKEEQGRLDRMAKGLRVLIVISTIDY